MQKNHRPALQAAALALAVVLAPVAQAQEAPSRDTGVGKEIAAQGNRALEVIRAEVKAALRAAIAPVLPAAPRVVKMSLPAGSTLAVGPDVRCEQ